MYFLIISGKEKILLFLILSLCCEVFIVVVENCTVVTSTVDEVLQEAPRPALSFLRPPQSCPQHLNLPLFLQCVYYSSHKCNFASK